MYRYFLTFLCLFMCTTLYAQEMSKRMQEGVKEGITIDLREPTYSEGVLTTERGGVVTGSNLRIQALKIRYTHKEVEKRPVFTIEAEDQIILEFEGQVFIGEKLLYDFDKKEGTLYQARTSVEPWFLGGQRVEFRPDGTYVIHQGFVTTSESINPDFLFSAEEFHLFKDRSFIAYRVRLKAGRYTLFFLSKLKSNLNTIFDSPIRYRFRWGGRQGPRFGLTYEIFSWKEWKTFIRFDYRLVRGPGGGFETYYNASDGKTHFESINYVSQDSSLINFNRKLRYRFEGEFRKLQNHDKTSILLSWDKLSDFDLPGSYDDRDFDYEITKRTQLWIRHQEPNWITNFYTRVRVNNYQTVKQELPSFGVHFRPKLIDQTGIIFDNRFKLSYLNYRYASYLLHVHNYESTRLEYLPCLYRPFKAGPITLTPELGSVLIFYGNSPDHDSQVLAQGFLGATAKTQLYRFYGLLKHVIEPYTRYRHYSYPTSSPFEHYIFDIEDGRYFLNQLTFGIRNSLFGKRLNHRTISRLFQADLYAHAFFNQRTFHQTIPKVYSDVTVFLTPTVRHSLTAAWDFEHHQLDQINLRSEVTVSENLAFSTEFRHRSKYHWRKVDEESFFLEMYRNEERLRHSPLSDRRDTLLLHLFYRFHPNWAVELTSRQGWNRLKEPSYNEFEIDLLTTIQTAWNFRMMFQHRENDNRVALYINVGIISPDQKRCNKPKIDYYD